jgi:hypothetical protein
LYCGSRRSSDEGRFSQGRTTAAQLQLLQIKTAILCLVGLDYPRSITVGNQTIGFAYPNVDVIIARGDERAGATVPAGAVTTITQIVIEPRSQPLPTDLTQYPSFFQFTATPNVPFNAPVTVGV